MTDLSPKRRLLALIREHALIEGGDFTLAQGGRASTYVDLRRVSLHPEGAVLIGRMVLERLADGAVAAVGGMATAAIPVVTAAVVASAATASPLRGFYVRAEAKTHGARRRIEGQMRPGDRVALLEDTMTSGRSTMAAVEAVRAGGAEVDRVVAVVDRGQGGAALYAAEGIPFEALVALDDIAGG